MVDKMTIMGKELSEMIIAGRVCHLHEQASPQCLLVQPLGDHENDTLPNEIEEISAASPVPFVMVAFEIADWERDLMPWSDHAVSKRPEAGTGAVESFRYLLDGLLPWSKERYGELPVVLGGYSLAGLFSLWAARETNAFAGIAAASPSIWIQSWPEYAESHPPQVRQVYLSLGEREEKTRNRAIAQIGERIRNEYASLERQLGGNNCALEWNSGGHFVDCERRLARAFLWNLRKLAENVPQ